MSFFSKIKFLTKIHNRKQRSSLENIEHKNDLYSKFSSDKFNQNLNSVKDIQGWRNRLIDSIPNFNEDARKVFNILLSNFEGPPPTYPVSACCLLVL